MLERLSLTVGLACNPDRSCDLGYACNASNECVIPLDGMVGVGVNADNTLWADTGKCDETCQRWTSALLCVAASKAPLGISLAWRLGNPPNPLYKRR